MLAGGEDGAHLAAQLAAADEREHLNDRHFPLDDHRLITGLLTDLPLGW